MADDDLRHVFRKDSTSEHRHRRLRYPQDKLYGREAELNRLFSVYNRLASNAYRDLDDASKGPSKGWNGEPAMAEMVLVSGYSGTGKSSLVNEFRDKIRENADFDRRKSCWFIQGAFEQGKTDPYSGFRDAFASYCLQLAEGDNAIELNRVTASILKAAGSESKILTDLLPQLTSLIGDDQPEASCCSSNKNSVNRLKFLFLSFVEVICGADNTLVLFLDDLQRADAPSLDLLTALMTTPSLNRKLLFIGCFRCNEVDEHHPFMVALGGIEHKRNAASEIIELSNLTVEAMNEFFSDTLRLDPEETWSLTDAVYPKTNGNIFYTKQSLEQLNQKQALRYDSIMASRWVWDADRINKEMDLADNVVDVVTARILKLPQPLQQILSVAAFIRKTFDLRVIQAFVETHCEQANLRESSYYYDYDLVELLDMAVQEGLLENRMGSTTYAFAHDRIQQAASSLAPATQADKLSRQIGTHLAHLISNGVGEDWMVFVAADHLNATLLNDTAVDCMAIVDLARLDLAAGERAVSLAAFVPASEYFRKGLEALGRLPLSPWRTHYELALALHHGSSHIELSIGDYEFGWDMAHEVLDNSRCVLDKLPSYMSITDALSKRQKYAEAVELATAALEILGLYPKGNHQRCIKKNYRFVKRAFQKHTDDEFLGLPQITDPLKLKAMELLLQVGHRSFMLQKMTLCFLVHSIMIRLTFELGLCGTVAPQIAAYGLLLCGKFNDPEGARRMANLAHCVLKVTNEKRWEALTLNTVAINVDPWFYPLTSVMETLHAAHISGMETGEFEMGFRSFFHFQSIAYAAGMPLRQIEANGTRMIRLMDQYNVHSVGKLHDQFRVMVLTLIGGEIDKNWTDPLPNQGSAFELTWYLFTRLQLAYFFEDLALAEEIFTSTVDQALGNKGDRPFVFRSQTFFFASLLALKMALNTGERKHWARVRMLRKQLKRLTKVQGYNILHKYYIIEAQYLAILLPNRKNVDKIRAAFDKAITAASRAGFTQDSAIANELAGEYFLRVNERFWAKHYLSLAYQEYKSWHAQAKADHLQRKCQGFVDTSLMSHRSFSTFQRRYIKGEACEKHKAIDPESLNGSSLNGSSGEMRLQCGVR